MNRLAIFISLIFIPNIAISQSIYFDAMELKTLVNSDQNIDVSKVRALEILDKYHQPDIANDSLSLIEAYHSFTPAVEDPNPFINFSYTAQSSENLAGYSGKTNLSEATSFIGGLNATTIADAAVQFLIERSKEELVITFFDRFKKQLADTSDLGILFPTTALFVNEFESYQYSVMLNAFKEAFTQDLNSLPETIPKLNINYPKIFDRNETKLVLAGLEVVKPIKKGAGLTTILETISNSLYLEELTPDSTHLINLKPILQFANIISESFYSNDDEKVWVNYSQIEKLLKDEAAFKIYLGLVYQQIKSKKLKFYQYRNSEFDTVSFVKLISSVEQDFQHYKTFFRSLNSSIQVLENTYTNLRLRTNAGQKITIDELMGYGEDVLNLLYTFDSFKNTIQNSDYLKIWPDKYTSFISTARKANGLILSLNQKKYSAAVVKAGLLLKEASLDSLVDQSFFKYATFIAAVAESESSEEVKNAIEAAVLPAGSSRIKRRTKFNTSLNGYLGGYIGREYLVNTSKNNDYNLSFGVSAPIGIALSWGKKPNDKNFFGGSSIFVSLLDLGAIASVRLNDENSEDLPEFELQNIIAPGLFWGINIADSPFTFILGGQYGPQLRKISTNDPNNPTTLSNAFRLQAGVTVDIPLFNLKTIPWD